MSGRFGGFAATAFKPVEGGYIYQAPSPWLIGRGSFYRVTEAQKAEIAARLRKSLRITVPTMIALMSAVTVVSVDLLMPVVRLQGTWAIAAAAVLAFAISAPIGIAVHLYHLRMIRPLVAGLPHVEDAVP